jgi:hypothetical protein
MISVYFTRQGFVSIEILPETERFNSAFFTEKVLLSIVRSVSIFRLKMQAQGYWIHIGNARPHNSTLSFQQTEVLRFTRLAQPPYPSDLASCDFFLFGYLKKEHYGKNFKSQNGMVSG